jgi:alpha-beta hydrolase superfamily lysophospholipase
MVKKYVKNIKTTNARERAERRDKETKETANFGFDAFALKRKGFDARTRDQDGVAILNNDTDFFSGEKSRWYSTCSTMFAL